MRIRPEWKKIDLHGADSSVYLDTQRNHIVKVYRSPTFWLRAPLERQIEILQRYKQDTETLAEIMAEEWEKISDNSRTINFERKNYDTQVIVVPQGRPIIMDDTAVSKGQEFISGPVFWGFFMSDIDYVYHQADRILNNIQRIIYDSRVKEFGIVQCNVKPRFNGERIDFYITDLAGRLEDAYPSVMKLWAKRTVEYKKQ